MFYLLKVKYSVCVPFYLDSSELQTGANFWLSRIVLAGPIIYKAAGLYSEVSFLILKFGILTLKSFVRFRLNCKFLITVQLFSYLPRLLAAEIRYPFLFLIRIPISKGMPDIPELIVVNFYNLTEGAVY